MPREKQAIYRFLFPSDGMVTVTRCRHCVTLLPVLFPLPFRRVSATFRTGPESVSPRWHGSSDRPPYRPRFGLATVNERPPLASKPLTKTKGAVMMLFGGAYYRAHVTTGIGRGDTAGQRGGNLAGNESGVCPECGTPWSTQNVFRFAGETPRPY